MERRFDLSILLLRQSSIVFSYDCVPKFIK